VTRGQLTGVQQVGAHQDLGIVVRVAGDDVQNAARVGDLLPAALLGRRLRRPVVLAEQLGRLVQQRHVRRGPVAGRIAQQARPLRRGEPGRSGREEVGGGEQVGQQPLRREDRPQPLDDGADLRVTAQLTSQIVHVLRVEQVALVQHVGTEPGGELPGQRVDDLPGEDPPRPVVRPA